MGLHPCIPILCERCPREFVQVPTRPVRDDLRYSVLGPELNCGGRINALWEDVLLCQFHDVLPGSALEMVYRDAERVSATNLFERALVQMLPQIHRRVAVEGHALLHKALQALHAGSSADFATNKDIRSVFTVDTLSLPRRELVQVPIEAADGFVAQKLSGGNGHLVLFETLPGKNVALPVIEDLDTKNNDLVKGA